MHRRRLGGVTLTRVSPHEVTMGDTVLVKQRTPTNEIGFTLCRATDGSLVTGPMAEGTPVSVNIPIRCPVGSKFDSLFHTHPGGIAYPSNQDIQSAKRVGAKNICIDADGTMRCFRLRGT